MRQAGDKLPAESLSTEGLCLPDLSQPAMAEQLIWFPSEDPNILHPAILLLVLAIIYILCVCVRDIGKVTVSVE